MKTKFRDGLLAALAVTVALLAAADGLGQPPAGKGPPPGKGKGPPLVKEDMYLKLLSLEPVQKEIGLTSDQLQKFRDIGPELRARIEEILGPVDETKLTPEDRRGLQEKMRSHERELQAWVRAEIDKVLSPQQKQRLQELAMQVDGAKALNDPGVIKELRLSEAQLAEMEKIKQDEKTQRDELKRLFPPGGGKENDGVRKEQEERIRRETEERTWGLLTKEQQRVWEKITGKSFDVAQLKGPPKPPMPPKNAPPQD
jgi:hypothetical protein